MPSICLSHVYVAVARDFLLALVCLASSSCGSSNDNNSNSNSAAPADSNFQCPNTSAVPVQACCDVANAIIDVCVRCQLGTHAVCVQAITASISQETAGGGCSAVVSLRDQTALYNDCLPALSTLSCADFTSTNVPASCQGQLLVAH